MIEVTLRLPEDAREAVLMVLRKELSRLESMAANLEAEIRAYERKYGLSSDELLRQWNSAIESKTGLSLPEEADLDLVEWRALYELYTHLMRDIKELKESIKRLERA